MGLAIAYFSTHGYTVCLPLTDSQDYDLVVDKGTGLHRVQVKTSSAQDKYGRFQVTLRVCGGNRSGSGKVKLFDRTKVDAVFVCLPDGRMFFIPSTEIKALSSLMVGNNSYDRFLVENASDWSRTA